MKILQIITRMDSIGGAQRHVVELSKAAVKEGHEVHLAYGGSMALAQEELQGIQLHPVEDLVRPIAPLSDLKALFALKKLIGEVGPDVVATHSTKAGILGRYAAWMAGALDVHTVHGWSVCFSGNPIKRFLYRQIEGKTHRLADGIICVSEFDLRHAHSMGLDRARTKLIYNGRYDAPVSKQYEHGSSEQRIVSVGRLAWPKQPESLLRYLVERPDVKLDLVGDGPREDEVRDYADALGVADRVVFHGHVDNIYPILAAADLFALVSDWEGFPMSTLEAMSVGLPTVVSDVGGAAEAVTDGVTGYCIPRGDEVVLHERLDAVLGDRDRCQAMGVAARDLFQQQFRMEDVVAKTLAYYGQCVGGRV